MKEQVKLCDIATTRVQAKGNRNPKWICSSKHAKKKVTNGTHTLRHALVSKPGGRFPVRIGSICKNK
jgi:hypothetical protein